VKAGLKEVLTDVAFLGEKGLKVLQLRACASLAGTFQDPESHRVRCQLW